MPKIDRGIQIVLCLVHLAILAPLNLIQAADKPKIIAGVEGALPPWAYVEKGEYKGIAIDAFREIAKSQELQIDIKELPWPSLIPALAAQKIDVLVTGVSVTCERDKTIDFTIPFWEINQEILVSTTSKYNAITAMCCGARVASQTGSSAFDWVEDNIVKQKVGVKHVGYEDYIVAVEDLIVGRVDSVLCDTDTSFLFIKQGKPLSIAGTIYTHEPYAFAVPQGDPKNLLPKLNAGFVKLYTEGKWAEIVKKYIPEATIKPIPSSMPSCIETYQKGAPGL